MTTQGKALLQQLLELPLDEREAIVAAVTQQPTPEQQAELNRRTEQVLQGTARLWTVEESMANSARALAEHRAKSQSR